MGSELNVARRRILLVEDDADLRSALADALSDSGHEIIPVGDGREALGSMRANRPDVVVLDLMMPGLDGWQFRVEQRRDPMLAEVPVVAISASASPAAAAIDADAYIRKPVAAAALLRAIDDVLVVRERRSAPARFAQTERIASLGTLAAGVAHEINNPLTYVLLHLTQAARLVPDLAPGADPRKVEQLQALLKGALDGVERIRIVTSGIRTFSQAEDLPSAPVDLHSVLTAALELISNDMLSRARVRTEHGATPLVMANEGRLGQAFLSVLTNAVQALPEGGARTHEIRVSTSTDARGWAVVEISDDGEGIPEHIRGRIFEPFFSTRPVGQGTGLGLSICQGIVSSVGGGIAVSSAPGGGTTFRIELPPAHATVRDARAAADESLRSARSGGG